MAVLTRTAHDRGSLAGMAECDPELEARLRRGLEATEDQLRACVAEARHPAVAALAGQVVTGGGKRLRPLMVLLGAEFGDHARPGVTDAAMLVELVHAASLCHDDVMDQAGTRRGAPSVNAVHGNRTAVLTGNWLLAKGGAIAAGLERQGLLLHTRVTERLVAGQVRELTGPAAGSSPADALAHYFAVISGKSASLISVSLRLGAVQAAAPDVLVRALGEYGEHLGLAFQISDDLLDITSDSSVSGKEQGKDLAAGVSSLPVLLALADERPKARKLRELLTSGRPTTARQHRRLLAQLRASDAMAEARAMMHDQLGLARAALADVPDGPARDVLDSICDFVARRDR
ncbi:polyprenyl synthetase family protein [Kitasatospora sp. NPDC127111]|uniref:polyprenyl synthetase family protein n=1 Tax=Kitasatospora sp. NPDC127111 TaxID=3345363 RepID=UPI003627D281